MSSLWNSCGTDSGILRKNEVKDKIEELLVFGYACKLFRDDQKALEIDQGKHLIPWMGDNTLKIDRYDGRGTLSDLSPYQSSKEGYDAMRWLGLSESDRKIEQLCDEERYYALNTNEDEEQLYKEEELKRLQSNQIQYNYEETPKTEGPTLPTEDDDEPFTPSPDLDLPIGIILPKTVKLNARIEKTALFISKEGPQMEILLKTKQSGNPQFGFLNQDNDLWRYYRHILMAIKTGRYKVLTENNKPEHEESKEDSHYLHPSLAPESITQSVHIPPLAFKPSADCAYSQLIQRIQGHSDVTTDINSTNYQYLQYQQYYYDQNYYYNNYQQNTSNPYAQIVSNLKTKDDQDGGKEQSNVQTKKQTKTLFSLAAYSDSENEDNINDTNEENENSQAVVIPPADIQVIIDKMAAYVAKNGADFEAIVKSKGDQRFVFLEKSHQFHSYYKYKLKECEEKKNNSEKKEETGKPEAITEEGKIGAKIKEKKIITPVCFSIKKPQTSTDQVTRDRCSALPVEDSTDDEEQMKNEDQETNASQPHSQSETAVTEKEGNDNKEENVIEIEDPIMELIDLTEELEEKRDKRAEDRLKDKIAAAAREKLAEKNRALQLERKKRAAAFLSQLKPSSTDEVRTVSSTAVDKVDIADIPEEFTRLVYHIEKPKSPQNEVKDVTRSRSSSKARHKTSHRRKNHKRSHSHSRKRKRDRRSHDRKKLKRRHSKSHSRSKSPYRREKRENSCDSERKPKKNRANTHENSSFSSDYESEEQK